MLPLHISFTVIVRLCECLATIRSVFAGALTGAFIFYGLNTIFALPLIPKGWGHGWG